MGFKTFCKNTKKNLKSAKKCNIFKKNIFNTDIQQNREAKKIFFKKNVKTKKGYRFFY